MKKIFSRKIIFASVILTGILLMINILSPISGYGPLGSGIALAYSSCAGACGEILDDCACDEECFDYYDCCPDVCTYCDHPQCDTSHSSCEGACGEILDDCSCSNACHLSDDCCFDACIHCPFLYGCGGDGIDPSPSPSPSPSPTPTPTPTPTPESGGVCGNNIVEYSNYEECDGTSDDACPEGVGCIPPGQPNECLCEVVKCDDWCKTQTYTGDDGQSHNYLSGQCSAAMPDSWWEEGRNYGINRVNLAQKEDSLFSRALAAIGFLGKDNSEMASKVNIVDCKDNFKSGSVKFEQLSTKSHKVKAGEEIIFKGALSNKNNFPVAEGLVFVKVHRLKEDAISASRDFLVDEFVALKDINLWPNERKDFNFSYKIPESALEGEYSISFYFASSEHFQISGITFLPGLSEKSIRLSVEGSKDGFWIDGDTIIVNDKEVKSPTWVPVIQKEERAVFSFLLKSTLGSGTAKISADIYNFDLLSEDNKIERHHKEKTVSLESQEQIVDFTYTRLAPGSYVLKIKAQGENQESLLSLRFTVLGSTARIINSSLSNFPLKKGETFSLATCFSNATDVGIYFDDFAGRILLELRDKDSGDLLAEMAHEGDITLKPTGLNQQFKARGYSDNVILISRIYNAQGELLDEAKTEYNADNFSGERGKEPINIIKIALIVLGIVIGISLVVVIIKKGIKGQRKKSLLVVLVLFGGLIVFLGVYASVSFPANFECIGSDQPCCQYLYDYWGDQDFAWEDIEITLPLASMFKTSPTVAKMSNDHTVLEGGTVTNISSEDSIYDIHPSPGGDYIVEDLFFATPAINWVDDIGTDGSLVYYSDPSRTCKNYDDVDDFDCPPNTPWFVGQNANEFSDWCNEQQNISYHPKETAFQLPEESTQTVPYTSFGLIPTGFYGYNDSVCAGTQVTCERTMNITVSDDSKMVCELENSSTGESCSTDGTGSCSLKAVEINSHCYPREEVSDEEVQITTRQYFDCFAYLDRGVFVQVEDGAYHRWENKNHGAHFCQPFGEFGDCYCEWLDLQKKIKNQECHGMYYPMKLDNYPMEYDYLKKTYTIHIADSSVSPSGVEPGNIDGSTAEIEAGKEITYTLAYSDMYSTDPDHGLPWICHEGEDRCDFENRKDVCGEEGTYLGGSCDESSCNFICDYSDSVGDYTAQVRIENEEKFAETDIYVTVSDNNPPEAKNLTSSKGTGCWDDVAIYTLNWLFSDEDDGDTQSAYRIQIDKDNNLEDCDSDDDCVEAQAESGANSITYELLPNTTYWWRVKVRDDNGAWSVWPSIASFDTAPLYPRPDFEYQLDDRGIDIRCNDDSCTRGSNICYCNGGEYLEIEEGVKLTITDTDVINCPGCSYEWETKEDDWTFSIDDEEIPTPSDHVYNSPIDDILWFRATSNGNTCSIGLKIAVGDILRSLEWKEIIPF